MMTRRAFLAAGAGTAAAGALALDAFRLEPERITITRHYPGGAGPPWRLVQVADVHLGGARLEDHPRRVAEAVAALRPDLVALTGDQVNGSEALPALADFVSRMGDAPVVAVYGNWERAGGIEAGLLADALGPRGRLLVDETAVFDYAGGRRVRVTGLDDWSEGRPDLERALEGAPEHGVTPRILLQHCPEYRDHLPDAAPFDLMLSGHTHGGQVAFFGWAPIRPRGSGRYVAGWYRDAGTPLYVSRGIGTTVVDARFMAPPEIAVFDFGSVGVERVEESG